MEYFQLPVILRLTVISLLSQPSRTVVLISHGGLNTFIDNNDGYEMFLSYKLA